MLLDYTPWGLLRKAQNAVFDTIFYDVSSLTFDEWFKLNPLADRKGKIIVVSPTDSQREPSIRHYRSVEEFRSSPDWNTVFAIVITGVGSSAVGTAALARNVADACKGMVEKGVGDVAGIISGYGLSDVVQEGLGGWYFYGKLNQYRYDVEIAMEDLNAVLSEFFAKGTDIKADIKGRLEEIFGASLDDYVPFEPDVHALDHILNWRYDHVNRNIRLLVGHSKGNLLIADVLNHMSDGLRYVPQEKRPFSNLAVVTLGAVVDISKDVILEKNQHQFLGTFDSLGYSNSRSIRGDLAHRTRLPGKWHSLNRHFLGHMDVFDILQNRVKLPDPPDRGGGDGDDPVAMVRHNRVAVPLREVAQGAMANRN